MKWILIFLTILVSASAWSQSRRSVNIEDPGFSNGKKLYDDSKYTEAIPQLEQAVSVAPENQDALYYLGLSYRYTSQPQKAIDALNKLEKLNPNYWAWFQYEMGIAYTDLMQYDLAVERFEAFMKKFPHEASKTKFLHQAQYKMQYAAQQKSLLQLERIMKDPVKLSAVVNSPYPDYMPALDPTGSKLYFTMQRKATKMFTLLKNSGMNGASHDCCPSRSIREITKAQPASLQMDS